MLHFGHMYLGLPVVLFVATTLGVSTAVATAIVITAAVLVTTVVAGILFRPKIPKSTAGLGALSQTLNPDAFRIFCLGNTVFGNDERYWEVYGSTGFDQVINCATHKVTAFGNFYIEGNLVSFSGNAATGTYAGALSKYNQAQGITATGIGTTVGGGSLYGSAASATGEARYLLKWTYDQKILPNGFPSRCVQIGDGAPVYDPRKDSTNGGSGSHRPDDQTTWEYTPTDSNGKPIGRNNALQMLWYLLGWRITNPSTSEKILVCGRGVNPSDIDFASFITAANVCETEQYYTDFTGSTGDPHATNESSLAAGSQGVLLDTGGLWSYHPATDDTASIAVAFGEDDIVSGVSWNPKASIVDVYNQVGGTFIDPSSTSVYQPQPYPVIKDATYLSQDNNFPKRQTIDFTCVQSAALAQKLARIWLNRNRLTGEFKATFNYKALKANNWDCVTLTFSAFGWTNKLFRITSLAINPTGGIDLVLREEASSVYTGGSVGTYTPPSAGSVYDVRQQIALSGFSVTASSQAGSGSTVYDALNVAWTTVAGNVQYVELQYKKHTDTIWIPAGIIRDSSQNNVLLAPVQPQTSFDIQARAVSINGVPGAWSSQTVTSGNNTTTGTSNLAISYAYSATDTGTYTSSSNTTYTAISTIHVGQVNLSSFIVANIQASFQTNTSGGVQWQLILRNVSGGTDAVVIASANTGATLVGGIWEVNLNLPSAGQAINLLPYTWTTAGDKELVFQFRCNGTTTSVSLGPSSGASVNTIIKGSILG